MVLDHEGDYPSRRAAITSVAKKIGGSGHTLLEWVKKSEVDSGKRGGVPTETAAKLNALEREVRELRQANEILRKPVLSLPKGRRHILPRPNEPAAGKSTRSTCAAQAAPDTSRTESPLSWVSRNIDLMSFTSTRLGCFRLGMVPPSSACGDVHAKPAHPMTNRTNCPGLSKHARWPRRCVMRSS